MPKKPDLVAVLSEEMLDVLGALREQGGKVYPPRLRQLAALTGGSPTDEQVQKAAAKTGFTAKAVVTEKVGREPSLDAPVVLREDIEEGSTRALPALLRFALAAVMVGKGKPTETTAFTPSEVKGRLVLELQKPLLAALERGIQREDLPEDVAWVVTK